MGNNVRLLEIHTVNKQTLILALLSFSFQGRSIHAIPVLLSMGSAPDLATADSMRRELKTQAIKSL